MADKAQLETREAQCASLDELLSLAAEALVEPIDREYAAELVDKCEMHCQMPLDYAKLAEFVVTGLGDRERAGDLYAQAAEMLFEVAEFIAVAHGFAAHLGETEQAAGYLEQAVEQASGAAEIIAVARVARDDLDDPELASKLLSTVEEKLKGYDDFKALAETLSAAGDLDSAREFMTKGARHCADVAATVGYARDIVALFDDSEWARRMLDEAEGDCQFSKEFVLLASAYLDLYADQEKVAELIEQATEFCMTGEEQADLAEGYWTLLGDRERAAESYRKALADISDKGQLLAIATRAATEMKVPELALAFYAKAEERISSATDLVRLAGTVLDELGDREHGAGIYDRALERLINPGELAQLADEVIKHLDDRARASDALRKAYQRATDLGQLLKLLEPVMATVGDRELARQILDKARTSAERAPELVDIAQRAFSVFEDAPLARELLETAAERVASLGELKSVSELVAKCFAEDGAWQAQLAEMLARREANEEKYTDFQRREKDAAGLLDQVRLADAVMTELDDSAYARKLLGSAERRWCEGGCDLSEAQILIAAVDRHLGDGAWVERLVNAARAACVHFAQLQSLARLLATALSDRLQADGLARYCYEEWQRSLDEASSSCAYDFSKLARVVERDLGDHDWAATLLDRAADLGGDCYVWAEIGVDAERLGLSELATRASSRAFEVCDDPIRLRQVARRLEAGAVDRKRVRALYAEAEKHLEPSSKLAWAEGIIALFGDRDWAAQAYQDLGAATTTEAERGRLRTSLRTHLESRLY